MTDRKEGFPAPPPMPKGVAKGRRRRWIILLGAAVILAAGAGWFVAETLNTCGPRGSGVHKVEGECVGVTDGSYIFQADLTQAQDEAQRRTAEENARGLVRVQELIAEENARVQAESDSYVRIALLDPLNSSSQHVLPLGEIRNRLEGAYTALRRINTTEVVGNTVPQIQLVLASEGSTDAQREQVIDQLVEMSEQEENPLVAVIGLGVSTEQTEKRARELSAHRIPMVAAYLTADVLNYDTITGLIKASPSNRHYVAALRDYVDNTTDIRSMVMIRDANSDLEGSEDLFTKTLEQEFRIQMSDLIRGTTQQYTGSIIPSDTHPNLFSHIIPNICSADLNAVLYAGREVDLGSFIKALEHRICLDTPLTILTAGLDLAEVLEAHDLEATNLTVAVASTVDLDGWKQGASGTPRYFASFEELFQSDENSYGNFNPRHLRGANAIMMHDALLTAAKAVRLPHTPGASPTAQGVLGQLRNLNGENAVPGASGTLEFSADSPGHPVGKPVPVLQYPQPEDNDSDSRQAGELYYVTD